MCYYYEDALYERMTYEYDRETLTNMHQKDANGFLVCHGVVENGRITEKHYYATHDEVIVYDLQYDEHGNLIEQTFSEDGEVYDSTSYSYKAIEVPSDRAFCLQQQQRYLLLDT